MTHGCRVIGLIGVVLIASQAAAQENSSRWYGSIVGIRDMPDASSASTPTGNFGTLAGDIVLSDEAGFGIAVGRTVAWDLQVEVEATWRDFDTPRCVEYESTASPCRQDSAERAIGTRRR